MFVGRLYVSTDDAYVRANNTMLGARVAGHVTAVVPRDNTVVNKDDVVFRIDDGDYRIAVDSARTKIATQQATIDRIGRQVTALESAVEQSKAQLVSAEAALKRAGLDSSASSSFPPRDLPRAPPSRFPRRAATRAPAVRSARPPMTPRATMSR